MVIELTRLDGRGFTLNADLIEVIESNPDTYIRLMNGNSYVVREKRSVVVERVIAYRRSIFARTTSLTDAHLAAGPDARPPE